ncbi:CD63 antigen isoform X1 [Helicoverpa armigera]|uniref:CD63 antigen isoform X1 n=2 Tax=Helicoverpa armigera TaxID=29058 RepID=UPI0030831783
MCRMLVKIILCAVNLIFAIIGLGLIGVGIAFFYYMDQIPKEISVIINLDYVPYEAIAVGIFVFLIASSGFFGAIAEQTCPLITYSVFMGFFAATKMAIIILLVIKLPDFTNEVKAEVNNTFVEPAHNMTFHVIEILLQCCGTTGPDSYENDYNLVPVSCCKDPQEQTELFCSKEDAFEKGCTTMIAEYFNTYVTYFGYGLIGMMVWELLSTSSSIYILTTARSKFFS